MESAEIHEYGKRISDFEIKVTNQPLLARFICEFFKVSVHFPLAVSPKRCNVMTTQFFNSLFLNDYLRIENVLDWRQFHLVMILSSLNLHGGNN